MEKGLEAVACDFCGSEGSSEIVSQKDILRSVSQRYYRIVRCTGCGLAYTSPRPSEEEMVKYYSSDYAFYSQESGLKRALVAMVRVLLRSPLSPLFAWAMPKRLALQIYPKIENPLTDLVRRGSKSFMDIGCGSGESAHFWGHRASLLHYSKSMKAYGVEPSAHGRDALRKHGLTAYSSLSDVPRDLKLDLIRMNWSMEHVRSPMQYFKFIAEHLSDTGKALVCVPNYDGMIYKLFPECVELPVHLYHFRPRDIRNYCAKTGLKIERHHTFSYPGMFIYSGGLFAGMRGLQDMDLSQALHFQKAMAPFDKMDMGNDMFFVISKA